MSDELKHIEEYSEVHQAFIEEAIEAGLEPWHYHGRMFYEGPAVSVDDLANDLPGFSMKVIWDSLGLGYVVYPEDSPEDRQRFNDLMTVRHGDKKFKKMWVSSELGRGGSEVRKRYGLS